MDRHVGHCIIIVAKGLLIGLWATVLSMTAEGLFTGEPAMVNVDSVLVKPFALSKRVSLVHATGFMQKINAASKVDAISEDGTECGPKPRHSVSSRESVEVWWAGLAGIPVG